MSVGLLKKLFFAVILFIGLGAGPNSWPVQSWALTSLSIEDKAKSACVAGLEKSAYLDSYERMNKIGSEDLALVPSVGERLIAQIRISGIKHLNEVYLGPDFTENFLEFLEIRLLRYLEAENGFSGRITEANYKLFYIETFLADETFKTLIFEPLVEDAISWYASTLNEFGVLLPKNRMSISEWEAYVRSDIGIGFGPDETLATISYNLEKYNREQGRNLTIEEWRRELLRLRNGGDGEPGITGLIANSDLVWRDVLYMTRKMDRDDVPEAEILSWLKTQVETSGVDLVYSAQSIAEAILEYLYLLDVAERIPGFKGLDIEIDTSDVMSIPEELLERTHWNFYRNTSNLKATYHAHYVFAFDGIGFGTYTIRDVDAWVSRGAHLDQLENSLAPSNHLIHDSRSKVVRLVAQDLPDDLKELVNKYVSGDEGHGFLPALTPGQVTLINAAIANFNRNHASEMTYEFNGQQVQAEYRLSPLVLIAKPGSLASVTAGVREARSHIK